MSNETIALFSSDAENLYKADVYRALALPTGYILHFRYPQQFVQPELLTNLASVINQSGIILYVPGNDTSILPDERQLSWRSIRSVIIRDVEIEHHIGSVHFYLEMGDFSDATPHAATNRAILPPHLFVSKITVDLGPNKKWIDRVNAVKDHFRGLPFFLIESIRQGIKRISPTYSPPNKSSSYHLKDETDYQLNIIIYDPTKGAAGLKVENGSADVTLSIPAEHCIGAESDARTYRIQTHSLPRQKASSYSRLTGVNYAAVEVPAPGHPDNCITIEWTITKRWTKAWLFALLSVLASVGLGLAKFATDDLSRFSGSYANVLFAMGAATCIGLSAGLLYVAFNKK